MHSPTAATFLVTVLIASSAICYGQTADRPLTIGSHLKAPRRVVYVPPKADTTTKEMVVLELLIGPDGSVERVRAKSRPGKPADAATTAARQWRYEPTVYRGQPAWVLLHALVRGHEPASEQPRTEGTGGRNIADPPHARLYLDGRLREIPAADVKLRENLSPASLRQQSTILERLDLTRPLDRSSRQLGQPCGRIELSVKTNEASFMKALVLYTSGFVQDFDRPAVVYAQPTSLCRDSRP